MSNVIGIPIVRHAMSEVCGRCEYADFSIVDDRTEGLIVVCDTCGAVAGNLVCDKDDTC